MSPLPENAVLAEHAGLTRAEVDLGAIAANVRAVRGLLATARLMTVVKANAYGHGAAQVAAAALDAGAEQLGVYAVSEGLALRRAGIRVPILVFGPFSPAEARKLVAQNLTATITSFAQAKLLGSVGATARAHLKVDTGLERAGVAWEEVPALARALRRCSQVQMEGIFTHFATADERDKRFTWTQFHRFEKAVEGCRKAGFTDLCRHACNSAATLDLPAMHLDMVRCGILTYGYLPSAEVHHRLPLVPALRLVSRVSRVHTIKPGTGVGYGLEFRPARSTRIALVPVGYGDGINRRFGAGRGTVLVRGQRAPVVGRVSMDQITVDVSDIPGVDVGDSVTVLGRDGEAVQTADDVAEQLGTNSYEVLTALLPRVPRLYHWQGAPLHRGIAAGGA